MTIPRRVPWPLQLAFIVAGYAAVFGYGAIEIHLRNLAALRDPVYSSGGMWAWGDEMLAWYIFFLFLFPTFWLVWLMRQYEATYAAYAKVAFWFSVTAPACLGIFLLSAYADLRQFTDPLLERNWRAPFVFIVLALSRVMAPRVDVAKRLLTRALLIEAGTLAIFFAMVVFAR